LALFAFVLSFVELVDLFDIEFRFFKVEMVGHLRCRDMELGEPVSHDNNLYNYLISFKLRN